MADIRRGVAVVRALGAVDVGQGCVVQQGVVLAVEAAEGTDAMLSRCALLARPGSGGVLVKLVQAGAGSPRRPADDRARYYRRAAAAAGLRGVAFEAGGTILADREAAVAAADAAGSVLAGPRPGQTDERGVTTMSRYLHTMLRVGDLQRSVDFYSKAFGMKEIRRRDVPDGKYTLAFVGFGDEDSNTAIELTYNYGVEKYEMGGAFGHLAVGVPDVAGGMRRWRRRPAARLRGRPGR